MSDGYAKRYSTCGRKQELQAANKKVKKKREKKKSYVGKGGVLSAQEVQEAQREVIIEREVGNQVVEQPSQPGPLRT